eukprot:1174356-Pyramimonas_sp.AAC.1
MIQFGTAVDKSNTSQQTTVGTYFLASGGSHECPAGSSTISRSECQQAVAALAMEAGQTPGRNMQVGSGGTCLNGGWGQ